MQESKGFENIFAQTKGRCFHSIFDKSLNFEIRFFLGESDDNTEMSSCLLWLHLLYPYYSKPYSSDLNHLRHPHQLSFSVQPTIPSWVPLQNLQCLKISNGCFERLWQQDEEAPSGMKQLEICGTLLEEYPDFLGISTHVEKEVKKEVIEVPRKSKMKSLMVKTCRRLSGSLITNSASKSAFKAPLNGDRKSATVKAPLSLLEDLLISEQENIEIIAVNGNYCPNLQSLELYSVTNLIEVQLIGVETLNHLNISKCGYLKILSVASDLTELEELSISGCPMLEEPNLGHLSCLKKIRIADCNMNSVPAMFSFKMLVELNVSRCPNLHELCLAHLSWLEKLIVHYCDDLKSLTGLSHLLKLVEVSISWCWMLQLDLCLVGLNCLKSITADRSVKVKCFKLKDCKNLETVSGISFEMIQVVNICGCPELRNFPVICGRRCLELIIIDGCGKLNDLTFTDCAILKVVSGNFDLAGLSISDCPMLIELPSFEHLIYLEEIQILQCGSLQNMTLPMTLKRLELNSCRELKTMVEISGLIKLAELNIKRCPKLRLELNLSSLKHLKKITIVECLSVYNTTLPTTLIELTVQRCMKLQIKGGISHLTKLTELHISECPVIEEMPVVRGLRCLERITIDGCSKFSHFQVIDCAILKVIRGNLDLGHLTQLWISDCPELEELPCFASLTCLMEICIFRCRKLQKVTLPRTLKNLQLVSCKELKSVSEISRLKNLVELVISECGQLLDLHLEHMDSLERIIFDGCGKLNSFLLRKCQNLKRVFGNFDAQWISICGCYELEELSIRDCPGLSLLKKINIESCDKLQNITLPAKLTNLIVQRCRHLQRITGLDDLSKLTELDITQCPEIELPFLAELSCLERVTINSSEKLHKIILPASVMKIKMQWCKNLQMVAGIGNLSKLTELYISECPDLEELPILFGLNSLEVIRIDGCRKLNRLKLADCGISEGVSCSFDMGHQVQMWISDCPELEELSCLNARLNCLEGIHIFRCRKLQKITFPLSLNNLQLDSSKELKSVSEISRHRNPVDLIISVYGQLEFELHLEDMDSLQTITFDGYGKIKNFQLDKCQNIKRVSGNFDVKRLAICACPKLEELPNLTGLNYLEKINIDSCDKLHLITLPTTLIELTVQRCRNLKVLAPIGSLPKLTELHISECPEIEQMPVVCGLSCLENVTIDGCGKFKYLHVVDCVILKLVRGNFDLGHLTQLWISDCPKLEELPCFAHLTCLVEIRIIRCRKLQKVTLPRTLNNLQLVSCKELKSVSEISRLKNLVELVISECEQLELDLLLEAMDSLSRVTFHCCGKMIVIDSCEKLQSISLPTTLIKLRVRKCRELKMVAGIGNLTKLTEMCIGECPELEELPILAGLRCLKMIVIDSCEKLQSISLPTTLTKLTVQKLYRGSQMLTVIENLTEIEELSICESPNLEELPCFAKLNCLKMIVIDSCEKLHNIILPTTLTKLTVRRCRGLRMAAGIGNLTKLSDICIGECPELEELPILAGLSCLKMIVIDSCEKLQSISLPTALINLTVRRCRELKMVAGIGNLSKLTDMCIGECPELEELPILAGLSCLKMIVIDSCEKLQSISLPTALINLTVRRCRELKMVAGIGNLSKLTDMCIGECPELEELPILAGLSCLKMIVIDSCEKLQSISLPTALINLTVPRCRELKMVAGIGNLSKLTDMCIGEYPELEELPILAGLSCLKMIVIDSCDKLQSISLPTALIKLTVRRCRELKMVAGIGNLSKLTDMCIGECPELEELPILTGLSCLKMIVIDSCEKLQSISLPTALINLKVRRCRELKMVAGIGNLSKLTDMCIGECPELEELPILTGLSCLNIAIDSCDKLRSITLPTTLNKLTVRRCRELSILSRPSCLKSIIIESCERLENIQGIEELQASETIQFLYCSNAAIQDCVPKLKHVPSTFIQVVGRAADGAKSNLNPCLLSKAYRSHRCLPWDSSGEIIIICLVVAAGSSDSVHIINDSFQDSTLKFNLPEGESIITTIISPIITHQNYGCLNWQYNFLRKLVVCVGREGR